MNPSFLIALAMSPAPDAPEWPDLQGHWAFSQVTTAVSKAPLLGEVTTQTRALGTVRIKQSGEKLDLLETLCTLETSDPSPMVKTRYPDAFIAALSGNRRSARLKTGPDGFRFVQDKTWTVHGAEILNQGDALPTDASDPRVRDDDGDGAPGLTVQVSGIVSGQLRVVTRGWTALDARVHEADRVQGRVQWGTEQRVLGVTHWLLDHQPRLRPHPDQDRSHFALVRLPEATTCATVVGAADRLFAEARP